MPSSIQPERFRVGPGPFAPSPVSPASTTSVHKPFQALLVCAVIVVAGLRAAAVEAPAQSGMPPRQMTTRLPPTRTASRANAARSAPPAQRHMAAANPWSPPLVPDVGNVFVPPPAVPGAPADMQAVDAARGELRGEGLTLASIEAMACANNPTLVQARAHTQGALGMAIQAGLWPNPRLAFTGENLGSDGRLGEFIGATVRQEVVTAHKQQLSRAKYLARTRVAEWVAVEQQYKVLNDLRTHFFHTLGQQQVVEIQRELLKTAEDELLTRREQYNVGQANQAEVHQANIELQQQRLMLLAAENELRALWQSMTALAGVDLPFGTLAGPLESEFGLIEWSQALRRMMVESPQLQGARAKMDADRMQLERELVQSVPNLAVATGAGQDYTSVPSRAVGFAQLELDVPIWNRNEGTVREARSDLARQQSEIRRVALLLRNGLAVVYGKYITASQHVQNYRDGILPEARQAYAVLLDSYGEDRVRWSDVLAAQRNYFNLRVEYIKHLVELRENEVKIIGYLLHGGLEAPPNPVPPGHINVNPQPR